MCISERVRVLLKECDSSWLGTEKWLKSQRFPWKKKVCCLVLPLTPQVVRRSWRQASLSPWIDGKGPESLAQASGLDSGGMDTALCGAESSTASWKASLCLTKCCLLIFFCNSRFTVAFMLIFLSHFLWTCGPKACWRTKPKPNSPLVWMPDCHFWCLAVNRCPKNDLQMLKKFVYELFIGSIPVCWGDGRCYRKRHRPWHLVWRLFDGNAAVAETWPMYRSW